jgi:hypothetical protein
MGADIASACGQLVQKKEKEESKGAIDMEDFAGPGGKTANKVKKVKPAMKSDKSSSALPASSPLSSSASWIESLPIENLDRLENILTIAAGVSASCFLLSSLIYFKKR